MARRPRNAFILFIIVLILATLTSGAISVSQAIMNTEVSLLRRIPSIATIYVDWEAVHEHENQYDERAKIESLTAELIKEIGFLPYVRVFDFAIYGGFLSSELSPTLDTTPYLDIDWLYEDVLMEYLIVEGVHISDGFESFMVKGIHYPNVLDMEEGIIELIAGRVFTEEEIENGSFVALLPQGLAEANNLEVGSTFTLEARIYNTYCDQTGIFLGSFLSDADLLISKETEFELIGIFAPTVIMNSDSNFINLLNHTELNGRRIYTPIDVARMRNNLLVEHVSTYYPEELYYHDQEYSDILFALYDPLDLEKFNEMATELLPDFWMIHDLTHEFSAISNSMTGMQDIANWILTGVSIASLIVLGLLVVLLLHERREEIGIYLALGESKINVIFQMIIEIVVISVTAIVLALFIGNILSNRITITMLRQELIYNPNSFPNLEMSVRGFSGMGFALHMTGEEMLEAYSVSLDGSTILIFFGTAIGMILLSIIFPMIYLIKINVKDILTKAKI